MQKKLGMGKEKRGITLLALVITVIILVILAGVGISAINSGNIFKNATNVVEQSKIASKKEEIELVIINKMKNSVREITIDKIMEALEKKGIIDEGNSNEETGQVKTNPDGYIYEIKEKPNGDWEVKYVGKGELNTRKIKLSIELSTTGITDKVTITVTAKASAGVKSITMPDGSIKTYTGKKEVSETYEVTQNGEYTFTATNNKGETESKTVIIDNILEGTIQISAIPSEATNKSVTVTIEWPSGSENAIKEICSNGENKYTTVSGVKTTLTLNNNCAVKARIRNSIAEIKTATLDVTNIDRLAPNTFTPTATTTSNSITVTGSTTDQPATEKYGSSGIAEYYFSKDNGTSWQTNEDKTQTSYTYTELTQGTEYTIKMKAIDKAGNETITERITVTTINIANLGEIQISVTPSTPTNKDVTVTVTWPSNTTGLTKKISKDGGNTWSNYTGAITVSSNCVVKAKLIDTINQEGKTATLNITNIDKTNPTVRAKQSSVTITEGDSNELSNYFTITANGKYGISSTVYTDNSNNNAVVTNTNILAPGTHVIKCIATKETKATASATITIVVEEKNTGITAAEVASDASYIGKYVNYTTQSGDPNVKWRIFYADSSNIYLIASDYLKYDYVPTKTTNGKEYKMYKNSDYKLSFDSMYNAYTGSADITDARITKWMKWVGQYPNSTNPNIRSVAYMLDTEIWKDKYQNSYAEYVIGGPTIEMFCASYKATHPTRYIECESYTTNGYNVKWRDGSYFTSLSGLSTSELENLYVINDQTNAYGYWLASPSAGGASNLLIVRYDGYVNRGSYDSSAPGLRALVCLKSNVQLVPNKNAYDLSM